MFKFTRVDLIKYTKDHPNAGYHKAAEHFGVGRTQAQKILKETSFFLMLQNMAANVPVTDEDQEATVDCVAFL